MNFTFTEEFIDVYWGLLCCAMDDRFENPEGDGKSGKVKVTLVQALRLCTGRTAHRGSRGIALLFYDHGTGSG